MSAPPPAFFFFELQLLSFRYHIALFQVFRVADRHVSSELVLIARRRMVPNHRPSRGLGRGILRLSVAGTLSLWISRIHGFSIDGRRAPGRHSPVVVDGTTSITPHAATVTTTARRMGLYDEPLPPRPTPRVNTTDTGNVLDNDEEDALLSGWTASVTTSDASPRLFTLDEQGREVRDLLPRLSRRLDRNIDCYYEPGDRVVKNLVQKTSCHVLDACWALEACKGDIQEAWIRISTARRMNLNQSRQTMIRDTTTTTNNIAADGYVDEDLYQVELEEEFEERKQKRIQAEAQRKQADARQYRQDVLFQPGEPDQPWLPKANPKPVDDEPWFTG